MRTTLLRRLRETFSIAAQADRRGMPTREAVDVARTGRRTFLQAGGVALAAGATGCSFELGRSGSALTLAGDVGIVGAGLAGLACADALTAYGVAASVYEAGDRVGGRVYSMGGAFPGPVSFGSQVVERGGELIDTTHTTMRGYANRFGLTLENYHRAPGETSYFFPGRAVSEAEIVEEYRAFVPAMQDDLRTLGSPTADAFTPADEALDHMTLDEYLASRGAGPIVTKALTIAYEAEYGRPASEQSALAMLFFLHADRRNRFQPFGVFSDEKYHVAEGNQAIATGLAGSLLRPVELGLRLVRVAKLSDGRIELTLVSGRRTVRRVHDTVVLTVPFSVLRGVELDASLGIPAWKRYAIDAYSYGTNAKTMIGFRGRPWAALGSNGASYSDLANHQATWETNWTGASPTQGVLTDYASGERGARLDPRRVQTDVGAFLLDLDRLWPGAAAAAQRSRGDYVAHLEHWPSNPLSLGSYTNNAPGYFTTIADNEAKPVGNLFFAGEHTSSFYEWQGFMEGACLSGLRAAGEVADLLRAGRRAV